MESRCEQAAASEKIKDMQARGQAIPSDRGIVVLGDIAVARQRRCTSTNGVADFAGRKHVTFITFSSSSALACMHGDWLPPKQKKSDLTVAHRDSGDALLRVKVHPWWAADPASSMSEQDRETKSPLWQQVRVAMTETCSLFAAYVSVFFFCGY
ncbi:hypothetical protein COCMIDRAFT_33328 [Bipolaris oryzae ATCC 44560]|uniref:Uncharacterized protein n=1 Tax=Bipolaris oryzae ATCC 44560 TaxID=930090 RepID=W6ZH94_COCMI|nr:uncharacterized protein COCMIDRAFT_33328 [Bipolaris oryzae ATCC 44560]EUC49273.1 hypothetical protein COCMIDRAFT_33328 [Bipolaris oryzae ATCC 44560]